MDVERSLTDQYVLGSDPAEEETEVRPVRVIVYASDQQDGQLNGIHDHGSGTTIQRHVTYSSGYSPRSAGYHGDISYDLSNTITAVRDRDRREMQDLNEKLAGYIEKVRFLEAQNRKLAKELDCLKQRWGTESKRLKVMYDFQRSDARKQLDDLDREKAGLEIKVTSLEEQLLEALKSLRDEEEAVEKERQRTLAYCSRLADLESANNYLKRKLSDMESDREKDILKLEKLTAHLENTKSDLDNETLLHIDAENRRQSLEDEMAFLKMVHDQEMKELAGLVCRDSTVENREFWRNEIEKAMMEIRQLFKEQVDDVKDDMENTYYWKIQDYMTGVNKQNLENLNFKEEVDQLKVYMDDMNRRLNASEDKNQMLIKEIEVLRLQRNGHSAEFDVEISSLLSDNVKLKSEMEALLNELRQIADSKLGLEKELESYKRIVEQGTADSKQIIELEASISSQEHRMRQGDKVESKRDVSVAESTTKDVVSPLKAAHSSRIVTQKSSKGPVLVSECDEDGKFVVLENSGLQGENLKGWSLEMTADSSEPQMNHFMDIFLQSQSKIKIYSSSRIAPSDSNSNDLIFNFPPWSRGSQLMMVLRCPKGEERATYLQKTKHS